MQHFFFKKFFKKPLRTNNSMVPQIPDTRHPLTNMGSQRDSLPHYSLIAIGKFILNRWELAFLSRKV